MHAWQWSDQSEKTGVTLQEGSVFAVVTRRTGADGRQTWLDVAGTEGWAFQYHPTDLDQEVCSLWLAAEQKTGTSGENGHVLQKMHSVDLDDKKPPATKRAHRDSLLIMMGKKVGADIGKPR